MNATFLFSRMTWACLAACWILLLPISGAWGLEAGNVDPGLPPTLAGSAPVVSRTWLDAEESLSCMVVDPAGGYALFGTNTAPAVVIKVRLGAEPVREGAVRLEAGEELLSCAALDAAAGYAWFGTDTLPSRVVKVAVGGEGEAPRRVGAVTLRLQEGRLRSAVIDSAQGFALFGTGLYPGFVVKVALGVGDAAPYRIGSIILPYNEGNLACAALDPTSGYVYFGTGTSPGQVVKIAPGVGTALPVRLGTAVLPAGENNLRSVLLDTGEGKAWFGTDTVPGRIVQVSLGAGILSPSRDDAWMLEPGENHLAAGAVDTAGGLAWFATDTAPGQVVQITLNPSSAATVRLSAVELPPEAGAIRCGAWDSIGARFWAGTNTGRVLGLQAGVEAAPPVLAETLALPGGTGRLTCGALDDATGFALFGTDAVPGRILQVAVGQGEEDPAVTGELVLQDGEGPLNCAIASPDHGYVLFGTGTSPARVLKVKSGVNAPERIGAVTLTSNESSARCVAMNPTSGVAWFGFDTSPGRVARVAGGTGLEAPTWLDGVVFQTGEDSPASAIFDPLSGSFLFGTDTAPGRIVKFATDPETGEPVRVGAIACEPGEDSLICASIDPTRGIAFFAANGARRRLVAIRVGGPGEMPERLGGVDLPAGVNGLSWSVFDLESGVAWFGSDEENGPICRVAYNDSGLRILGTAWSGEGLACGVLDDSTGWLLTGSSGAPGILDKIDARQVSLLGANGFLDLDAEDSYFRSAVFDPVSGYAWLGTGTSPGRIVKVAFRDGTPEVIGAVTLQEGENCLESAVIDPAAGYAWFGTLTQPGHIVKVALGTGDAPPSRVGSLTLPAGEDYLISAAADPASGHAWFGTGTAPGRIVKISLGAGSAPPTRVGSLTLNIGENDLACAIIDPASGYGWFGTHTWPGKVVKVWLGGAILPPMRIGALTLLGGENSLTCATIDPPSNSAWFATHTQPAQVVRVNLGTGPALPTRQNTIGLQAGENNPVQILQDPYADRAWILTSTQTGRLVQIQLGADGSEMKRLGSLSVPLEKGLTACGVLDPVTGAGLIASAASEPGRLIRADLCARTWAKATRINLPETADVQSVRFYSHAAGGTVRLALYSDDPDPALLWESPPITNATADDWLTVPIPDGYPTTLQLNPGPLWLAFQTELELDIAGCTRGEPGDSFAFAQPYGNFPTTLNTEQIHLTPDKWAQHLVYEKPSEPLPLTVIGEAGNPRPAAGVHFYTSGSLVNAYVAQPIVASGPGSRSVCTGWQGEGAVPESGTAATVVFTLDRPSTLTWLWRTQYLLETALEPLNAGTVTAAPPGEYGSWYDEGSDTLLTALAASNWTFDHWSGAVAGEDEAVSVTLAGPTSVLAHFRRVYLVENVTQGGFYASLQEAVASAAADDALFAPEGVFPEGLLIAKPLTLLADPASSATILGGVRLTTDGITLRYWIIRSGHDFGEGVTAIQVDGTKSHLIEDNTLEQDGSGGVGIRILPGSGETRILGNALRGWDTGILARDCADLVAMSNLLDGNATGLDTGLIPGAGIALNRFLGNNVAWRGENSDGLLLSHLNSFLGNGVGALSAAGTLDARHSWWGDASGPSGGMLDPITGHPASGAGDPVGAAVRFDPWLTGPDPSLRVTYPTTGTAVQAGQPISITWQSQDFTSGIDILFTSDGATWTTLSQGVANTGQFLWTVPATPSAQARIRVQASDLPGVRDTSPTFTIQSGPFIHVTDPAEGVGWPKATYQTIHWESAGLTGSVRALARFGTGDWILVASEIPNTGAFTGYVSVGPYATAQLRIQSNASPAVYGDSAIFSIPESPYQVQMTAPLAGAQWPMGTTQTIHWTSSGLPGNVKITGTADGANWVTLAWDIPNTGSLNLLVNQGPFSAVRLRVVSMHDDFVYGESGTFSVIPGP